MSFRVDYSEESDGYLLVALYVDDSHYCGYVGIPKDHVLGELDYSSENFPDISVHGGVTFSGKLKEVINPNKLHCIGFDCAHFGDRTRSSLSDRDVFRDIEYVKKEVKSLYEQLTKVVKKERKSFYFEVSKEEK